MYHIELANSLFLLSEEIREEQIDRKEFLRLLADSMYYCGIAMEDYDVTFEELDQACEDEEDYDYSDVEF